MRSGQRRIDIAVRLAAAALVGILAPSAVRGDVTKAMNPDALNSLSSYNPGTTSLPGSADKIIFDSTLTGPQSYPLGGDLIVNGLSFTNFVGLQTITATPLAKLTLGAGGIASTNIDYDITINADINLAASQAFAFNWPTSPAPTVARTLSINGAISSAANVNLTIGGAAVANVGVVALNTPASYTGQTKIIASTLRMGGVNVLPSSTVVVIGGAAGTTKLQLNTFSQTIAGLEEAGAGTRQVINGVGGTAPILTINVPVGVSHDYGSALGVSGNANNNNFGLTKIGEGLQEFSNATNVFLTGEVRISGGALGIRLANGTGTGPGYNMVLDGGVYQSNTAASTFNRPLGTAAGQVQWTANGGGFSGKGGTLTVNLGGALAAVDWLNAPGAGLVGPLKFGHASSTFDVVFQNPINLKGAVRTIDVADNTTNAADLTTLTAAVTDGAGSGPGGITKSGNGILILGATNTYTGATNINGGVLTAASPASLPTTGGVSVGLNGALVVRTTGFTDPEIATLRGAAVYGASGGGFGYDVPSGIYSPAVAFSGLLKLYKTGGGDLLIPGSAGPNTHTLGTAIYAGRLILADNNALGTGPLTMGGGTGIASNDGTARTISSSSTTVTGAVTLGTTSAEAGTGGLTFTGMIDTAGTPRNFTVNVPTTFAAGYTNGGIDRKLGASTLTLQGACTNIGAVEVRDGTLIVDTGATLTSDDALRVMSTVTNGTARAVVRGTWNIDTTGGNIRVGHDSANGTGVAATQTNILDIFGTINFPNFTTGGGTQMGSDSVFATINMFPGSLLVTKNIINSGTDFGSAITTINIDGGTIRALDSRTTYMFGLTGGAFIQAGGVTFDTNGFNITISQDLKHDPALPVGTPDGGLKKIGAGILTLTGTATNYTGPTTITAGTLLVNSINGNGAGAVAVKNGGTLGGTGSISGPITLEQGGKLAPGASIGTLTVASLSLDSAVNGRGDGVLLFEIGSTGDQVVGTSITYGAGQLDLDDFTFSPLAGIGPGSYTLLTGVTAGTLGPHTSQPGVPGLAFYDAQLSQNGGNVVLTLTGVPEPATAGVLCMSAVGLLARRRQRRR
jgi:autotransporter-associated beta strand protein